MADETPSDLIAVQADQSQISFRFLQPFNISTIDNTTNTSLSLTLAYNLDHVVSGTRLDQAQSTYGHITDSFNEIDIGSVDMNPIAHPTTSHVIKYSYNVIVDYKCVPLKLMPCQLATVPPLCANQYASGKPTTYNFTVEGMYPNTKCTSNCPPGGQPFNGTLLVDVYYVATGAMPAGANVNDYVNVDNIISVSLIPTYTDGVTYQGTNPIVTSPVQTIVANLDGSYNFITQAADNEGSYPIVRNFDIHSANHTADVYLTLQELFTKPYNCSMDPQPYANCFFLDLYYTCPMVLSSIVDVTDGTIF